MWIKKYGELVKGQILTKYVNKARMCQSSKLLPVYSHSPPEEGFTGRTGESPIVQVVWGHLTAYRTFYFLLLIAIHLLIVLLINILKVLRSPSSSYDGDPCARLHSASATALMTGPWAHTDSMGLHSSENQLCCGQVYTVALPSLRLFHGALCVRSHNIVTRGLETMLYTITLGSVSIWTVQKYWMRS